MDGRDWTRKVRQAVAALFAIVLGIILTGCSLLLPPATPAIGHDEMLGQWQLSHEESTADATGAFIEFFEDGTFVARLPDFKTTPDEPKILDLELFDSTGVWRISEPVEGDDEWFITLSNDTLLLGLPVRGVPGDRRIEGTVGWVEVPMYVVLRNEADRPPGD